MHKEILHVIFLYSVNCVGVEVTFDHCTHYMGHAVAQFLEPLRY